MESGVYEILNTTNGKRYVGSAVNLRKRKGNHWHLLRQNRHHNRYLQNAWNKYGEGAFGFSALEYWEPEFLISFEQWWINMLRPEYNICKVAGSPLGRKCTDETKAKMSKVQRARSKDPKVRAEISARLIGNQNCLGHNHTAETKAKISAVHTGIPKTDGHRAKISAANNLHWSRRRAENLRDSEMLMLQAYVDYGKARERRRIAKDTKKPIQ